MNRKTLLGVGVALLLLPPFGITGYEDCETEGCNPDDPDDPVDPDPDDPIRDPDKGLRIAQRRPTRERKGDGQGQPGPGDSKKAADRPLEIGPGGRTDKQIDHVTPPPQRVVKVPRVPAQDPEGRFAEVHVRLLADDSPAVSRAALLAGPTAVTEMLAGPMAYELHANGVVLNVGTFEDPRLQRSHMLDGTRREGLRDGPQATFKVTVPAAALSERFYRDAVVSVYAIPGELGLRRLSVADMDNVRGELRLLGSTEPGELYAATFGDGR